MLVISKQIVNDVIDVLNNVTFFLTFTQKNINNSHNIYIYIYNTFLPKKSNIIFMNFQKIKILP